VKGIGPKELRRIALLAATLDKIYDEMDSELEAFRDKLAKLKDEADEQRDVLHGIIDDAHSEAESYYDDRSETWQDGERGQVYSQWVSDLETLAGELEEIPDIDMPNIERPAFFDTLAGDFAEPQY
jgi:chromosome segregation ATPase